MTLPDLVIRGEAIVDVAGVPTRRRADVTVAAGRIEAVGEPGTLDAALVVELDRDEVLLPGLVDTHVHIDEPGRTEWEGFATATAAAAAGGVTTLIDMPLNSIPPTIDPVALSVKRAAAQGASAVNVGFWGGAVPENLGSLERLHESGVFGFKAFLAPSGVAEFGHLGPAELDRAMAEIAGFGGQLILHCEDPGVLDAHVCGGPGYADYVASRPDEAETVAIDGVIEGVRRHGTRTHILHLSSAQALPALREARLQGLPITVETCPHYLFLASEAIPDGATQYKCAPPIRDRANQDALWHALTDHDVDFVVTDHSPSTAALKLAGGGDFAKAWGGISGLQTGLGTVWTAASARGIPLTAVVRWMCTATADFAGLPTKGRIGPGADADLIVFAPQESRIVHAAELLHRNPISAFDGATLNGVVRRVWLAGTDLPIGAAGVGAAPRGRLLSRPATRAVESARTAAATR